MARAFVIGIIVALAVATGIIALDRFGVIRLRQPLAAVALNTEDGAVAGEEEVFEEVTANDGSKQKRRRVNRPPRSQKKAEEPKPAKETPPPPKKKQTRLSMPNAGAINAVRLPPELPGHKIADAIANHSQDLNWCLLEAKKRGDDVNGRVLIQLTIDIYGRGSESHIKGGKQEKSVFGRCMLNRLKGIRFPSFSGDPVTVVFPIDITTD